MSPTLIVAQVIALILGTWAHGDQLSISRDAPDEDRWMYPFNPTPGTRAAASIFGNWEQFDGAFDNRDAQMIIGFQTAGDLAPEDASGYMVVSARITVQVSNEGIVYDDTTDPYQVFLGEGDPERIDDPDPGQPIELYGVGYRSGYTAQSWTDDAPFGFDDPTLPQIRTAYAVSFQDELATDISNHAREGWNPDPFATAFIEGVNPGDVIPLDSIFEFEIEVSNSDMQQYIIDGLENGMLRFAISSMTQVEIQGGTYPLFYCNENIAVELGLASAATLELVLEPVSKNPCDLNGDGIINGADLTILLGAWGSGDPLVDLDGSGVVDGADLTILLGCWG